MDRSGTERRARAAGMVAVVAHARKSLGGGLGELREVLAANGITDPLWYEVRKSRKAPQRARRAREQGADLIFVWGGDGTVQRCIDAVAGTGAVLAILPAGTANLLAANLAIPGDLAGAVDVGLRGRPRPLDTGSVNGEHFAVMAGAGLDARMIAAADRGLKDRFGRAAYLYTGARNLGAGRVKAVIEVDGTRFFKGRVSCVLAGNVAGWGRGLRRRGARRRATGARRGDGAEPRRVGQDAGPGRAGPGRGVAVRGGHQGPQVPDPVRPAAPV
jgi:diacylglycerol kinase (ATP)